MYQLLLLFNIISPCPQIIVGGGGCCCCYCVISLKSVKYTIAQIYLQIKFIVTNQNRLTKNNKLIVYNKQYIQKQNILHSKYYSKNRNINFFYCHYLSIKKPSCKCVRYNKYGIKYCTKFECRSQARNLSLLYNIQFATLCNS